MSLIQYPCIELLSIILVFYSQILTKTSHKVYWLRDHSLINEYQSVT